MEGRLKHTNFLASENFIPFTMLPSAWTYILTNGRHTTLYVGSTNDLPTRLWEHRVKQNPRSFTARYNVSHLVYYEAFELIADAVRRERFIKGKSRKWKEALINKINPEWKDLTDEIMQALRVKPIV
jgi:putative endonuclease